MEYVNQFIAMVDGVKLTTLFALILCNFLTGVAVAVKTHTFELKKLGEFLYTRILPYIVAYFGVGIAAVADNNWTWAVTATWGIILATLVGAILTNLKELGINQIPSALGGKNQDTGK